MIISFIFNDGGIVMSLVSIIIPIYNREKYIEKTLLSVLKQPNFDYEIIIINDGSTDKSLQICCIQNSMIV